MVGFIFIVNGLLATLYYYTEWRMGANAAQPLTEEETMQYEESALKSAAFSQKIKEEKKPVPSSQVKHESGAQVANLIIPKIEQKYSIYWGADDQTLKKGVGMFVSDTTTAPDGNGHTVLSGHRDTVFVRLGELKQYDELLVEYEGNLYTYQVIETWITDANDRTVIVKKNESILTLTTCYPFHLIGLAPDRYIIQANLLSVEPAKN